MNNVVDAVAKSSMWMRDIRPGMLDGISADADGTTRIMGFSEATYAYTNSPNPLEPGGWRARIEPPEDDLLGEDALDFANSVAQAAQWVAIMNAPRAFMMSSAWTHHPDLKTVGAMLVAQIERETGSTMPRFGHGFVSNREFEYRDVTWVREVGRRTRDGRAHTILIEVPE